MDFFSLLVKPGDPIIIVPPTNSTDELIDPNHSFRNRSLSRMLQSNRKLEDKDLNVKGVGTRLEAEEED